MAALSHIQQPQPGEPLREEALEKAIVQQIEWYMGKTNLRTDYFLKSQMDMDLWVPLRIILSFPKMQMLRVTDSRMVAAMLMRSSTVVEVDSTHSRIRPAWARSSILVLTLPRGMDSSAVVALFGEEKNTSRPTSVELHSEAEGVWHCTFSTHDEAASFAEILADRTVGSEKILAHVEENAFQSILHPAPVPGMRGTIGNMQTISPGAMGIGPTYFDGTVAPGHNIGIGTAYAPGMSPGVMHQHLHMPMQPVAPSVQNYPYISPAGYPASTVPAVSGYVGPGNYLQSPRGYPVGGYYMNPYGSSAPYDSLSHHSSAALGVPSSGPASVSHQGIYAESFSSVGLETSFDGSSGSGGQGPQYGARGIDVGMGSTAFQSMSQGGTANVASVQNHYTSRPQHSNRRTSQRHGPIQQHVHGPNSGNAFGNGSSSTPTVHGSDGHAQQPSRPSPTNDAKASSQSGAPSEVTGNGVVPGSSTGKQGQSGNQAPGASNGSNRNRGVQHLSNSIANTASAPDSLNQPGRIPKAQPSYTVENTSRSGNMGRRNKKRISNSRHPTGGPNGSSGANGGHYTSSTYDSRENGNDFHGTAEKNAGNDDRSNEVSKASAHEPNITAMDFPPLPAVTEASNKRIPSRSPNASSNTGSIGVETQNSSTTMPTSVPAPLEQQPSTSENVKEQVSHSEPKASPVETLEAGAGNGIKELSVTALIVIDPESNRSADGFTSSTTADASKTNPQFGNVSDQSTVSADAPPDPPPSYASILRTKTKRPTTIQATLSAATSPMSSGHSESGTSTASSNGHSDAHVLANGKGAGAMQQGAVPRALAAAESVSAGLSKAPAGDRGRVAGGVHSKSVVGAENSKVMSKHKADQHSPHISEDGSRPGTVVGRHSVPETAKSAAPASVAISGPRSVWANKPQSVLQPTAASKPLPLKGPVGPSPNTSSTASASSGITSQPSPDSSVAVSGKAASLPAPSISNLNSSSESLQVSVMEKRSMSNAIGVAQENSANIVFGSGHGRHSSVKGESRFNSRGSRPQNEFVDSKIAKQNGALTIVPKSGPWTQPSK